jgi:uncharacterized integral membrane protein (TIGR00698 family)
MTIADARLAPPSGLTRLTGLAPGLCLTAAIAALAYALRLIPGVATLSPMIVAVILGALAHNLIGAPRAAKEGVAFSLRSILRLGIVLLGLQITARQAADLGGGGLAMIAVVLVSTLAFTIVAGRLLGAPRGLALLIGVGTSICGASAVLAAKAAINGDDEDAAYAVACVTVFGTIAMFAYPLAEGVLHLAQRAYGLWAGASIHEIAQVVVASFQDGSAAGQFGTIAKLTRVAMMAPVIIAIGEMRGWLGVAPRGACQRPPFPWFVIGFLGLALINSVVVIPHEIAASVGVATTFLLSMAMAAMGLNTSFRHIRSRGLKPLALGFLAALFIAFSSLLMVRLIA